MFDKLAFHNPTQENYNIQTRASSEIAFGAIATDGTILSNTENIIDVEWDSDLSRYIITIEGVSYNNNDFTTIVSL